MSFWNLSDNTNATQNATGAFETGGGEMEPIPANTQLNAMIEEAIWDEYESNRHIKLKWRVLGGEYAKRVIYHKIHVFGNPTAKDVKANADKAKRMLAAIDANAGGQLMQIQAEPSDMDLARCLANKMMTIMVQVWAMESNGEKKTGNWVSAVSPRGQGAPAPAAAPQQSQQAAPPNNNTFDDDIPFNCAYSGRKALLI